MSQQVEGSQVLRFSTNDLPVRDRVEAWRENVGRAVMKFEIDPIDDAEFCASIMYRQMPGLGISDGSHGGMRYRRSAANADSDDLILGIVRSGVQMNAQRGFEKETSPGQIFLTDSAEPIRSLVVGPVDLFALRFPRQTVAPKLANLDGVLARSINPNEEALRLFRHYNNAINELSPDAPAELQRLVAGHVLDIVAIMLGATKDATEIAKTGGVRAARLRAIQADIGASIGIRDHSVSAVAGRNGVSTRYVQILFEAEGSTFSEYVLDQRLSRAHTMLTEPDCLHRKVSEVAFSVGFSDLSYFNRTFRRRYGDTPSGVRGGGKRQKDE
jgi:AraC-like DNA-binding protein